MSHFYKLNQLKVIKLDPEKGNVVEITNEGNVVGYNIFEISKDND